MKWGAFGWIVAIAACAGKAPTAGDVAANPAEVSIGAEPRRDGKIRIDDAWHPIAPMVIHEAKMDLVVACRLAREEAVRAGHTGLALCYDEVKRPMSAVKVLRVEHRPGTTAAAMHALGMAGEGAHFLVERTGGRYQILDLSYSARRAGEFRGAEIRVLACDGDKPAAAAEQTAPLVAELQTLYPQARVETVDAPPTTSTNPDASP